MVKVMSLLIKPESALGFSFGVRAQTEMKIWYVTGMYAKSKSQVRAMFSCQNWQLLFNVFYHILASMLELLLSKCCHIFSNNLIGFLYRGQLAQMLPFSAIIWFASYIGDSLFGNCYTVRVQSSRNSALGAVVHSFHLLCDLRSTLWFRWQALR